MTHRSTAGVLDPAKAHLPTLLIADDDPVVVSTLAAQLGNAFELIPAARDAQEAIEIGTVHQPDPRRLNHARRLSSSSWPRGNGESWASI